MVQRFIKRPVLSTVVSIILVILGVLGYTQLPISLYPEIAPPTIQVTATYPGADAETVLSSVVAPLEEQINGVEGMTYITSTASNSGTAQIQVFFELGVDPDIAAVNVQNRVAQASSLLPQEVTETGVITNKQQNSRLLIFALYSPDGRYDTTFLENYARINLVPRLQRIDGVGTADAFGSSTYAMRIWLKPAALASYNLTPNDVIQALNAQSFVAGPGAIGENSSGAFQYTLRYQGRLSEVSEYKDIILREGASDASVLRLGDVADVQLGAQQYSRITRTNGGPGAGLFISQTAGSNAQQVVEEAIAELDTAAESFPDGVEYTSLYNANSFLTASIDKVYHTFIEAFILVFIVVLLFLQDWRATLIPAIAVPVSIIGTFFFLSVFGYSINLLTLFALILAIGIVVDDAIIVVEIIHARLEEGMDAMEASIEGMKEITGAIISVTLVMVAIFVPVTFIPGSTGVFFEQFGVTLAVAITISAVNALTLSPALCALFLKAEALDEEEAQKKRNVVQRYLHRFTVAFNSVFEAGKQRYRSALAFLARHSWIAGAAVVVAIVIFGFLLRTTPSGFLPDEDQGTFFANIALPSTATMERTQDVLEKLNERMKTVEAIDDRLTIAGFGLISGTGSQYGFAVGRLSPWGQREAGVQDVIAELQRKTADIKEAQISFFAPPVLQGFGNTSGFTFSLQDEGNHTLEELEQMTQQVQGQLMQRPSVQFASSYFSTDYPQYQIDVDVPKAQRAGISPQAILQVMQAYFGSLYVSNFTRFGKLYRVYVQAAPEDRASEQSLQNMFVRNGDGEMAPISSFVTLSRTYGPQNISRFNLFPSVDVTGGTTPGYSSGDAIDAVKQVFEENVPEGYSYAFSGLTREQNQTSGQELYIFALCLIFVYFVLCAQYESYLVPWSVLLPLPMGLAGAFGAAQLFGISNNVYLQIASIMLMGLLAKNAILIVEFALERRRDEGMDLVEAALTGAEERFRPILMTSFAFVAGLIPLATASGVNANANQAIGLSTIGGMLVGTILGLFIVPGLFVLTQMLQEKISGEPAAVIAAHEQNGSRGDGAAPEGTATRSAPQAASTQ